MPRVSLTIDGRKVTVPQGTTILKAARTIGVAIPTLCHFRGHRPRAVCRICVVAVSGSSRLVPACVTPVTEGMQVETQAADVIAVRRTLMEFILAEHHDCGDPECQIERLAEQLGVQQTRFQAPALSGGNIFSTDFVQVITQRCVHCDRCISACAADRNVLSRRGSGAAVHVAIEKGADFGGVECSVCGDCVAACPAGGLAVAR